MKDCWLLRKYCFILHGVIYIWVFLYIILGFLFVQSFEVWNWPRSGFASWRDVDNNASDIRCRATLEWWLQQLYCCNITAAAMFTQEVSMSMVWWSMQWQCLLPQFERSIGYSFYQRDWQWRQNAAELCKLNVAFGFQTTLYCQMLTFDNGLGL